MNVVLAVGAAAVIQFAVDSANPRAVVVSAEPVAVDSTLSLHRVVGVGKRPGPAIFSDTEYQEGRMTLRPRFNLSHGAKYVARVRWPDGRQQEKIYIVADRKGSAIPRVTAVFPQRREVPANLLKFYIHFSEPMREGREVFDRIHLVDDNGKRVHSPWRRMELWDTDAQRLTLWIHPGRIKRGVNLRETFGPVLQPNTGYRLVIEGRLRSAAGQPMGTDHVTVFRTSGPDRSLPIPAEWTIDPVESGSRKPLNIRSNEGFDHVLLIRHQWIEGPDRNRLPGRIVVERGGAAWRFVPQEPWGPGPYVLCVDEWLEDLAGNTPVRPFERDLSAPEPVLRVTRVPLVVKR